MTEGQLTEQEPVNAGEAVASEKMLPQSEVDKLIHQRTKAVGDKKFEEGYHAARAEHSAAAMQPAQQAQPAQISMSPQEFQRQLDEGIARNHHNLMYQSKINDFVNKMQAGSKDYPDFEQKVVGLNLHQNPDLALLASDVPNPHDVMYELANKPEKLGQILGLQGRGLGHLAKTAIEDLARSVRTNREAKAQADQQSVKAPLSQVTPSTAAIDSGNASVSDFKRMLRNKS